MDGSRRQNRSSTRTSIGSNPVRMEMFIDRATAAPLRV